MKIRTLRICQYRRTQYNKGFIFDVPDGIAAEMVLRKDAILVADKRTADKKETVKFLKKHEKNVGKAKRPLEVHDKDSAKEYSDIKPTKKKKRPTEIR